MDAEADQDDEEDDLPTDGPEIDQGLDEVIEEEEEELQPVSRPGLTPLSSPGSEVEQPRTIPHSYFPDMNHRMDMPPRLVTAPALMTEHDQAQSPLRSPSAL
jgi:hypothetical protein